MIKSEQSRELGGKWFSQLQEEIEESSREQMEDFRKAIKPDSMGPVEAEGIDDED